MRKAPNVRSLRFALGATPAEALSRTVQVAGAATVASALAVTWLLPIAPGWRSILVLVVLSLAVWFRRFATHRAARPAGTVTLDAAGLRRDATTPSWMFRFGEPFGISLLTTRAKDRLVLAVTTPTAACTLGVRLDDEGAERAPLLARASIGADEDVAAGTGDDDACLGVADACALVAEIHARSPGALERTYVTATRGELVELDGARLRAGERGAFDLAAPVEWRAFHFQESGGRVAAVYQATWLRQADAELILVAPAAGDVGYTDEPPPRELRVGVDRIFLAPLRRALERAPRASRHVVHSGRPWLASTSRRPSTT